MTAIKTRTFQSGNSQAVRLPKSVAYPPGTELEVVREGETVILRPTKMSFEAMVTELRKLPKPRSVEERDVEAIPERPGL